MYFFCQRKKEAQKLNELKQTSKKKDQQSYAADSCCVRQEMNSEANILHNDRGFAQAGLEFLLPGSSARKETTF
jgi:hypothetical protein